MSRGVQRAIIRPQPWRIAAAAEGGAAAMLAMLASNASIAGPRGRGYAPLNEPHDGSLESPIIGDSNEPSYGSLSGA